ncbi:MAG: anthranilate synthase component II [Acidimicrobiales bacterium]
MAPRILLIDNYDSFVYNLVQELGELGAEPIVYRNDAIGVPAVRSIAPDALVVSPGPGRPEDAGVSLQMISELAGEIPILGVCLGHQSIGVAFGARVVRAREIVHGKTSAISHNGQGILSGLPVPFEATRYHSLVIERGTIPPELSVDAETADGTVMAISHRDMPVWGVQFHPESILTAEGPRLLQAFLDRV